MTENTSPDAPILTLTVAAVDETADRISAETGERFEDVKFRLICEAFDSEHGKPAARHVYTDVKTPAWRDCRHG